MTATWSCGATAWLPAMRSPPGTGWLWPAPIPTPAGCWPGGDSFGHKLWYLANETAVALGVTKMQATSALLPTYLDYLGRGRIPGTSALRLDEMARLLSVAPGDLPAVADRLLSRSGSASLPH